MSNRGLGLTRFSALLLIITGALASGHLVANFGDLPGFPNYFVANAIGATALTLHWIVGPLLMVSCGAICFGRRSRLSDPAKLWAQFLTTSLALLFWWARTSIDDFGSLLRSLFENYEYKTFEPNFFATLAAFSHVLTVLVLVITGVQLVILRRSRGLVRIDNHSQ